jgi:hypothetical protein
MKIGDPVKLDEGKTEAWIKKIYDDGAIDAEIDHDGHPADGAVTYVRPGNFEVQDASKIFGQLHPREQELLGGVPERGFVVAEQTKPIQDDLDQYHTVTRTI